LDILSAISILAIIASIAIGFLRRFSLTNALIVGNLAVFLFIIASFSQFGGFSLSPVQEELGFRPSYLVTGESLYTVFTQMFVHATIAHVIVNILFLFLIGSHLESRIGKPRFAAVYFIAGLAGALAESMIQWGSPILIVGASGAISGAMGAMLLLYPKDEVPMFLGPLFLPRVPVWLSVGSWFAIQVVMVFLDSGPVAYTAHLGGFLTGMIVAQLFSLRPTKEVRPSAASYESLESFAMTSELKEALTVIKEEKFEDVRRAWLEHFAKKARCPKCGSTPQLKGDRLVCRCGFEGEG